MVTPFLPGDSLLFATGALCAQGRLSTPVAVGLLVLAAFTGNAVNYTIGRIVGPRVFSGDRSVGILAPAAQPRAPAAGARVLRGLRRQGGHSRPLRPHRADVRAVRGGRRGHALALVRAGQPDWRGRVGCHLRGRRPVLRQRPHREAELLARRARHRRGLAAAHGRRTTQVQGVQEVLGVRGVQEVRCHCETSSIATRSGPSIIAARIVPQR